jgi:hypothetical protein
LTTTPRRLTFSLEQQIMRRALALTTLFAITVSATTAQAQAKPNFAGSWTMVVDPAAAPAQPGRGGGGGLGQAASIAQDAKTLTITRTTQAGEVKSVYNLDGSESKNTVSFGGNAMETTSTTKWDGNKFVITTNSNFNGNASVSTLVLSIDAQGGLVVESTRPGRGGGAPTTTTTNYKKS